MLKKGYSIIRRNYRCSSGEVDLIAYDDFTKTVVFVEVKLRKEGSLVSPFEAVDEGKARRVRRCARSFLATFSLPWNEVRFDVIGIVEKRDGSFDVVHLEGAF